MRKNPTVQAAVLIGAALILAVVANGFASRTRKLMLPGYYPNALKVPVRVAPTPVKPAAALPTATAAPTATIVPTDTAPVLTTATNTATIATATAPTTTTAAPLVATTTTPPATKPPTTAAVPSPQPSALSPRDYKPHPNEPYHEISGDEAAQLHAAGVLFLDARRTSIYEEGHIAGARTFSVWESDVDDKVNKLYEERSDPRDQDKPIVIYCSGGACEDSHMLAQKLWAIQFNNVYVYKDGFPDWQKRGGTVKTGGQS
jgi:rhodanese-related sulfurtransferase